MDEKQEVVDGLDRFHGLNELHGLDGLLLVALLYPEGLVAAIPLLALQEVSQLVLLVAHLELQGLVDALPLLLLHEVEQLVLLVALLEPEELAANLPILVLLKQNLPMSSIMNGSLFEQ